MVNLTIDGKKISVHEKSTILDACKKLNINIPTLCHHPELKVDGNCNICCVKVEGKDDFVQSCSTLVEENMIVKTNTDEINNKRKSILKDILSNHPNDCLTCEKASGDCELQNLCYIMDVNRDEVPFDGKIRMDLIDDSGDSIVRDMNKCILCGRCISVCRDIQGIGIYEFNNERDLVNTVDNKPLKETECINCGQCIKVCPVGALYEKTQIQEALKALLDNDKHVVVQMAPAVKNTLGEEFGLKPGTDVTGKVVASLRKLGANKVFNTDFSADVTIMEEGTEFINRLKEGKNLPLLTSCSPGWIKFVEHNYPQLLNNVSSCKSPQQMFGALSKSYYAKKSGIDPKDIVSISIMPCTAKKFEANRPEMQINGIKDVDIVLTTRELAKMIKLKNIPFLDIEDEDFDKFLGKGTGAARIFATSGGVMEAALRTVSYVLTNGEMNDIDYKVVRGLEGIKEAEVEINGTNVKVAVVNGALNAKKLLDKVVKGEANYHFIEVMGCPGGCLAGGGAPIPDNIEIKELRKEGLYNSDKNNEIRRSFENPEVKELYDKYLGEPGGHLAHKLLHTHYLDRSKKTDKAMA
ncbi:NADH-dependent [FeFe] hydrogenase, group A6 [Tepidibacter formicigenes]|jgi:iron-only hydrogenase group A|uniref:NAD(P)-dependent iron-only hydrogenase catalytic subunit n=1 Tax=Tepidibacter formicigenes DSM 15518 TaxID=1123349 RepID=A0A1M6NI49_9FIRM|nr:NADH-dependent [FeFe] hydrogenase, group A6 [Tepidibacter formicigenes]SHJ95343.1 NAD(P)-dependent iron-only hydrogenase catalytic subunit [Tepidibacter formicigenes DSM 15518]